jgi:hypothetical protein
VRDLLLNILDFALRMILILVEGLRVPVVYSEVAIDLFNLFRRLGFGVVTENFLGCAIVADVFTETARLFTVGLECVHRKVLGLVANK